ncbi:HupE/UreJ family protein [Promicromonospora sp. NFX87]|uniref:HupE/UreJ family protein n=1 Tax=Promicromonospora sp. NFX87 TaxID=3402691 RepID=UPI003AFB2344
MRRLAILAVSGAVLLLSVAPAAAHVVPATTIELDVHESDITATVTMPAADLATASGIALPDGTFGASTSAQVNAYLRQHVALTSDGEPWTVEVDDLAATRTEQWGTGAFPSVTAELTLVPPSADRMRAFTLVYDAIIHQVITSDIFVTLHSDWSAGQVESVRDLGTITLDTRTGEVAPLEVDLDDGSMWQGFAGMVRLGVSHIAEGTDHQLFLLTLLLPAPLLAAGGRWNRTAPTGTAVRRITTITIAFTVGHSVTLVLGTLGLPVPQQPVEALIAASILVAAAHAVRPVFPGREPIVAAVFGLVHGMAFSTTLSSMDLSGTQLGLSLLGFNLGIEIMQLVVVLIVLPPLVVLARTRSYGPMRVTAAVVTAVAATGWLLDRLGVPNVAARGADALGVGSPWIVGALWLGAAAVLATRGTTGLAAPYGNRATRGAHHVRRRRGAPVAR